MYKVDEKFIKSVLKRISERRGLFGSAAKLYISSDISIQKRFICEIYENYLDNTDSKYTEIWGDELLGDMKAILETKDMDIESKKHKVSKEILWHFQCGSCEKWWSVGDHQLIESTHITCPHCSVNLEMEINNGCGENKP